MFAPERVYACRCGVPLSPVTALPVLPEPSLLPRTKERAARQPALSAREQHENREKERENVSNW